MISVSELSNIVTDDPSLF